MNKTVIRLCLALCLMLCAAACNKPYKDEYGSLRVDRTFLLLGSSSDTIPIMVYYSGKWEAVLDESCEWAEVWPGSGKGIAVIHLAYDDNPLSARETALVLSDDKGETITINITQNAGI